MKAHNLSTDTIKPNCFLDFAMQVGEFKWNTHFGSEENSPMTGSFASDNIQYV
jgi:hypothetical protein